MNNRPILVPVIAFPVPQDDVKEARMQIIKGLSDVRAAESALIGMLNLLETCCAHPGGGNVCPQCGKNFGD